MSAAPAGMNPFPGLRPFTQEEDYLFFGREEQTIELLQRLGGNRFVAVVGTSGSGKSSLVRCGLLSELLGGRMLGAGSAWEIAVTHPGGNPLALLTDALLEADLYDREVEHARENLLATLSRSHFGLVEAVKQADLGEETNFLLVVDQFEEIFRFNEAGQKQQEVANEFVSLLLEAASQTDVPIYVVLTMRSDFIGECGQFEGLAEMVNRGEFLIPRLNREQYKRVIEGPIKVAGGQIAPRLLQRLLNDLGQQADQLPCLQHALMRTWDVWTRNGDAEALDLDDYQRVGKMSQALSLHADEIYESLGSDRQRVLCQGIFQALTVEESNSRGIRRPQRLGRLCQILEVKADELLPIIDAYRQSGVTFLMPSPDVELTDQTIIDISHESLMRVWTRLRQWVEEETQAAGIYHRLSESAELHEQGKAGLFRDPELGIALAWRESKRPNAAWAERYRPGFDVAIGFLEASQQASVAEERSREAARQRELDQARQLAEAQKLRLEQQQRAALKLRKLIGGLAVVALIAGAACVVALFANQRANRLAKTARENEEQAMANASRAELSQQETAKVLAVVESQKATVEGSLKKAKQAELAALDAEETGRKLLYTTDMRLAPFVLRDDRTTAEQLRVLLTKHIPAGPAAEKTDLRGFEWHYYQNLLERGAAVFSGHEVAVADGALDATGQLVTLDEDGQLRRWNLESQDEYETRRRDLPGGLNAEVRVLSPNGRLVALAEGTTVRVLDGFTGRQTLQINSTSAPTRRLIFSRDGDSLVIIDDKIRWCNSGSGKEISIVNQGFDRIESLSLSDNGLTLAVVGEGPSGNLMSTFRLDATTKIVTPLVRRANLGGTLSASAVSPDGQWVAVGAKLSGNLAICNTATGRLVAQHPAAHASPISAIAVSDDGLKLATADDEGTIKIWVTPTKLNSKSSALLTLKGHRGAITSVGFSIDRRRLVTTSADKTARVWDLENAGAAIRPLDGTSGVGGFLARYSPDGQLVAVATGSDFSNVGSGSSVKLWDAATGKLVRELRSGDTERAFSVAFSPTDPRLLAVGYGGQAEDSHVVLWDIDTGTELARLSGATDLPNFVRDPTHSVVGALAFSPDGKHLVAGFGAKNMLMGQSILSPLKVWDVATRRLIRRLNGHTNYCVALDFSKDGKLLASGSRDGTVILWSTATWKATQTLQNPDQDTVYTQLKRQGMVEDVAFSPDGQILAMASREGNIHVWDVASGQHLDTLKGHSSVVDSLAFSPDGRTLASGSGDQTTRLWNVQTRRELMQLDSGSVELGEVRTLAFSPDGTQLVAGGRGAAFWFTAPVVWNDADRAAAKLRLLLQSGADFQRRIRMLSENLRLYAALEKLDAKDVRVAAALAATQANWHASRQAWSEAVEAYDRLAAAEPKAPADWLRTPGLLRLATALLNRNRPVDAAALLTGGAKRRELDGLPAAVDRVALGLVFSVVGTDAVISALQPGTPAAKSGLRLGDVITKINDTDLEKETQAGVVQLLAGEAGTTVRLTVSRAGSDQLLVIELTREKSVIDLATGDLLHPLRTAVNERLVKEPRHPGLLELRAELAGQWSDSLSQLADYNAAIEALSQQGPEAAAVDLQRLYARRGHAHLALRHWQQAAEDYARVVTDATIDENLLSNQALALAESLLKVDALVPTSEQERSPWRFITQAPAADWMTPEFNDSRWRAGVGPFGTADFKRPHTAWSTPEIWLRRSFEFDKARHADSVYVLRVSCDDDAEVSLNGKPIGRRDGYTQHLFVFLELDPLVRDLLVSGTNTLAVHCQNPSGPGDVDVGLYAVAADSSATLKERFAAREISDPWTRLAAAHRLLGNQQAVDELVARRPQLASRIGDAFIQDQEQDWARAAEIYSRGLAAQSTDVELLSKRARAFEALKNWEAATADWLRAANGNPDGARLLADFARRLAGSEQRKLAKVQLDRAEALYEKSLQADADNDVVAADLAQLLLDKDEIANSVAWTILQPTELKSDKGATLTLQGDGSILASGTNTDGDVYKITAVTDLDRVAAVRLEALPDASLPKNGPGRHETGNFHLQAFRLFQSQAGGDAELRPVPIGRVSASFEYKAADADVAGTIDESLKKFWHVWGRFGEAHQAVFLLQEPVPGKDRSFVVELRHGLNLGRFRLSVCGDPALMEREDLRVAVGKLTDPWQKLAAAYAVTGRPEAAAQFFSTALQRADGYEARKPVLELAARFESLLPALARQLPDDSQLQLAFARMLAERGKQRLARKQPAEARAELQKSRDIYARLRVTAPQAKWTVLTPTELRSKGGETLTVESDGSTFVSGPNPKRAVYTLKLQADLPTLTAIRLETLPDPRLPEGGAGRYGNGNFHLAEFSATVASRTAGDPSVPIQFSSVIADTRQTGNAPTNSIDGSPRTLWDTYPRLREAHWAVYGLKSPERIDGRAVSVTLDSGISSWGGHGLGRFRLSGSSDPEALNRARHRTDFNESEVVDLCIALAKVDAQQGRLDDAAASFTEALELAVDRDGKSRIIAEAALLEGMLERLAQTASKDARFQAELARHFSEQGQLRLADAARNKAVALFEGDLAREPENSALAGDLADLLLIGTTRWTVLKPVEMKSTGGATLTLLPDDSILASGKNPQGDAYTIVAEAKTTRVSAIRLEALTHESLPNQGPGRDEQRDRGNFFLTNLEVRRGDAKAEVALIKLSQAAADYYASVHPVTVKSWNIGGGLSRPHAAVFRTETPVDFAHSARLEFSLQFSNSADWPLQNLGRFRLSVCDDPAGFDREQKRFAALRIADSWTRLAAAYAMTGQIDAALQFFSKALGSADEFAARKAIIECVEPYDELLTALSQRHPDDSQLQLALARSLTARGRTALTAEKPIAALAELNQAQDIYTRLLSPVEDWTVLTPVELQSASGTKLAWQKDGTVFADQPAKTDTYALTFQTELKGINGLRLEALTDSRLPKGGPGWATREGNFVLSEVSLETAPADSAEQPRSIALRNASASYSQPYWNVRGAVDGSDSTGWAVSPFNADHTAVFETSEKIGDGQATRITVRLSHQYTVEKYLLGRFRLSLTNDAATLRAARIRLDLKGTEVADLNVALAGAHVAVAKAHAQQGRTNDALASFGEALRLARDRAGIAGVIIEAAPLKGVLNQLAEREAGNPQFQAELARHFAEQGHASLANAARKQARTLFEQQLAAKPDNAALASDLADLLLSEVKVAENCWIDDSAPSGANLQGHTPWEFVSQPDHPVLSGHKSIFRKAQGISQHFFDGAVPALKIGAGARLFAHVFLDPQDPPRTLMLQFNDGTWEHRAFWGEDLIPWGASGNQNHVSMGPLPKAGEWIRLEVDPARVGLSAGAALNGWAFTQYGGACYWDAAGCTNSFESPWQKLAAAYYQLGDAERAVDLLAKSTVENRIASWLEPELLIDGILDPLLARHPEQYAALLPGSASAAAERGRIDLARTLYERLLKAQPENGIWKERTEQLRTGVFGVWNFDSDTGQWSAANDCRLSVKEGVLTAQATGGNPQFLTPANGPAGAKAVVLRYRTDQAFTMKLYWADSTGDFDGSRHQDYPIPASAGEWREITLSFSCDGTLKKLRLDPETSREYPLEVDSIMLRQLEPIEYVNLLETESSANPKDTILSLKVAALLAWFGKDKEFAVTRQRILANATDIFTADRAAKACSILTNTNQAEIEAALAQGRTAVRLGGGGGEWNLLALGMAEYRSGNFAAADKTLRAAAEAGKNNPRVAGISAYYLAMSLFRQGRPDEARKVTIAAAAQMRPLPADEQNPLAGNAEYDDVILWLAYKEAKGLIQLDTLTPIVPPDANAAFKLDAASATLHGKEIRYLQSGGQICVGSWGNGGEWASWNARFAKPGQYEVSLDLSTIHADAGFQVEIDDQKLTGIAPQTATWDDYQGAAVGRVEIKTPGVLLIQVRAKDPANWKAINLRVIRLTPVAPEDKPK